MAAGGRPVVETDGADGRTALVFPGMGQATFASTGRFMVLDRYVRPNLAIAEEVLGASLLSGFRAEVGEYGVYAQVAFVVSSLALADRATHEWGVQADLCTGPSFGHRALTAYVRALDVADAIRLTVDIAACERSYFAAQPEDLVTQCFVRVPDEALHDLCLDFTSRGEWVEMSARLDRGHYLVSMSARLLDEMIRAVRGLGGYALQTMRPPVHARRFGPLRRRIEAEVLPHYPLADPALPIVADQDGRLVRTAEAFRGMLLDTFDHPVDWPAVVRALVRHGVRTVYVTGPDLMFHRLPCTTGNFRVVPLTHKTVFGTAGRAGAHP